MTLATSDLAGALARDPSMGPAHLRIALRLFFGSTELSLKRALAAAIQLLWRRWEPVRRRPAWDAAEPVFDRTPPDWAESERRLSSATVRLPNDAELFATLGWVRDQLADTKARGSNRRGYTRSTWKHARALFIEAVDNLDDVAAMGRAADACLDVSPQASECLRLRTRAEARAGECSAYERDGRRLYCGSTPTTPRGTS